MRTVRGSAKGKANLDRRHAKKFAGERRARHEREEVLYFRLEYKKVLARSAKAFLLQLWNDSEEWVPFSQICGVNLLKVGMEAGEIKVSQWFAEKRGYWMDS